jgi:hypothetical protein
MIEVDHNELIMMPMKRWCWFDLVWCDVGAVVDEFCWCNFSTDYKIALYLKNYQKLIQFILYCYLLQI